MKKLVLLIFLFTFGASAQRFVTSFSDVTSLLASPNPGAQTNAFVLGYYEANDGYGGNFYYDKLSSASTNTSLTNPILKPNNYGGRWFKVSTPLPTDTSTSRRFSSDATDLFTIGDSFTYGAGATQYTNAWPSVFAENSGLSATNLANGSFTIPDANWSAFSGWTVTNTTGPSTYIFSSPSSINDNQNWAVLIGFNDIRTGSTSSTMFRKGLDHLIHWLGIPTSAKRTAQSPDASTGSWTAIPWSNGIGSIGAYSSSGTLTWSNVIGSDVYLGYIGWGTNFGGSLQVAVDGVTITNFTTASVAYGNREYINGTDPNIPDNDGPYGNGKIDFCPQVVRVTGLGFSAHTVVVTAASNPVYVLWCAGNGWSRTSRKGPNIFIGSIPRQSPWTSGGTDSSHAQFNAQLYSAINAAKASYLRVSLSQVSADYVPSIHQGGDGVHPNDAGHIAIAGAFTDEFSQDLDSIISGLGIESGTSSGAGVFTSISVSGTSSLVGNVTGNGRLLMLPTAGAGGTSHRFGYGSVGASGVQVIASDTSLDRVLTIGGNYVSVAVNSTGAGANLSLGTVGQNVSVAGAATVAETLNVSGTTTIGGRLIVNPTATNGGWYHRVGQDGVSSSAVTFLTGDTALDRSMTFNGQAITAKVNSTGAAANMIVGSAATTVVIGGSQTVSEILTVTGNSALNGGMTLGKTLTGSSGTEIPARLQYTVNQSGTAGSQGLSIEATTTALGSGSHRLINGVDDGSERFYVTTDGRIVAFSPNGTTGHLLRGVSASDSQILLGVAETLDRRLTLKGNAIYSSLSDGSSATQELKLNEFGGLVSVGGYLRTASGIQYGSATRFDRFGSGSPEGVISADVSSTWRRTDGGASTTFYVKESGSGNTGWVALGPPGGSGVSISGTPSSGQIAEWTSGTAIQGVTATGTGSPVKATAPTLPSTVTIGAAGGTTGAALFKGTTSGTVTLSVADTAGTHTIKLPVADGSADQVLKTDGSGQWGWTTASGGGAPSTADYLVKTADGGLSAERVVTDTTSITVDWATGGQAKFVREALTGDVTAAQNNNSTTIANDAVSNAKMANMAASTIKARVTGSTGDPEDATLSQVLDLVGSAADGDILVRSGGSWGRLGKGQRGAQLYSDGSAVSWKSQRTHAGFIDDFIGSNLSQEWQALGSGGGAAFIVGETGEAGIYGLNTSTSSTGSRGVSRGLTSILLGGGEVYVEWRAKLPALSTPSQRYSVNIGLTDQITTPFDGAVFEYTDSVNSGNWTLRTTSNGSSSTANTSTAADTNWHEFGLLVNAGATRVDFYIDDVNVGNLTGSIPTGASRNTSVGANITKSIGITQSDLYLGYAFLEIKFTTPR